LKNIVLTLDTMDDEIAKENDEIAKEYNSGTDGKDIVKRIVPTVVSTKKRHCTSYDGR
jgi:hypothetical protein